MKKIVALLLCLSLALSLCACGQKSQEAVVEMEEVLEREPEMNGAPDGDPTWMLDALEVNADQWLAEDMDDTYTTYTVTDWDHNGLLEMTVSTYYSQEMAYGIAVYEVADHGEPLKKLTVGDEVVYMEYSASSCYYNEDENRHYYVYGAAGPEEDGIYVEQVYALFKQGDEMHTYWLGTVKGQYVEAAERYDLEFFDPDGNLMEGDVETEIIPAMLGTKEVCTSIRNAVRPEWFEGDIQSMLSASFSGWYQELANGNWFEIELYTDPGHFGWNEVESPEIIESSLPASGLDVPFRIVPSEDITVTLEVGDWTFLPLTFHGQKAFTKKLKAGQAYEFMAPMGEVLPLARLTATSGPEEYVFYDFAMDGSGEAPALLHLTPDIPRFPSEYDTFMELCIAYAGIAAKYEDHYGITPEHIWDALANGITRYAMAWSDPDNEGNIYLDDDSMESFIRMMCPYMYVPDPEGNVSFNDGEYIVKAVFDEYLEGAYVSEVMMAGNASCGKAIVVLPSMGNMDVEVSFELGYDWWEHIDNPWVITGAVYAYG